MNEAVVWRPISTTADMNVHRSKAVPSFGGDTNYCRAYYLIGRLLTATVIVVTVLSVCFTSMSAVVDVGRNVIA